MSKNLVFQSWFYTELIVWSRDVLDFGSGSGKSGTRSIFGNPAKSDSGLNFDRISLDLGDLLRKVIFLTTANSTGTYALTHDEALSVILLPGGRWTCAGFLSCHHSHRNSLHHHLPASHQRGSSVQLVTLYLTTAVVFYLKIRDIDFLEVQQPPLGRVTF